MKNRRRKMKDGEVKGEGKNDSTGEQIYLRTRRDASINFHFGHFKRVLLAAVCSKGCLCPHLTDTTTPRD